MAKKVPKKHPWYARKGYLHFDLSLDLKMAARHVKNPDRIASHKFSPLIYYQKLAEKFHAIQLLKPNGSAKESQKIKNRN
ncbi:MAG: hypothetical protein IPJ01_07575 [Micavibrio sp.]|nr:hypothetical protein [Micavibrio sp.]